MTQRRAGEGVDRGELINRPAIKLDRMRTGWPANGHVRRDLEAFRDCVRIDFAGQQPDVKGELLAQVLITSV